MDHADIQTSLHSRNVAGSKPRLFELGLALGLELFTRALGAHLLLSCYQPQLLWVALAPVGAQQLAMQ